MRHMDVVHLLDEFLGKEFTGGWVSVDCIFALLTVLLGFLLLLSFFSSCPFSFAFLILLRKILMTVGFVCGDLFVRRVAGSKGRLKGLATGGWLVRNGLGGELLLLSDASLVSARKSL